MSGPQQRLSAADRAKRDARIRKLAAQGMTASELEKRFCVSYGVVAKALREKS
jgi:transposase